MKIRGLSIKNCLSFCEKGLNESNSIQLGDFNLFIGSNNAGKSNLLKVMKVLENILSTVRNGDNLQDIPISFAGMSADWLFVQDLDRKMSFSFSLEIEQADGIIQKYEHLKEKNPVWFMFGLKKDWPKIFEITGIVEYRGDLPYVTITKVEIPNDHSAYREDPILFDRGANKILALRPDFQDKQVWTVLSLRNNEDPWRSYYSSVENATVQFLHQLYDKVFRDLLINIPAIREIKLNGDEVSETLATFKEARPNEHILFERVQQFISDLIFSGEDSIELRFPGRSPNKSIEIAEGKLVLPLSHYGSGVEQMLALATKIVQHGSNKILLIEEPEAHFHPDLQRRFVRFLRKNQDAFRHQYLMATHSNIFVNEFMNMGGNVYFVYAEQGEEAGPEYSQVDSFSKEDSLSLFRRLGVRPSDLLFANGILVVEGPTDKTVYSDWARKIGKAFDIVGIEVIDVEGAGNVSKYLGSQVIQRSCFGCYGLCDKHAEKELRQKLIGIVPDENFITLSKGDLEDYYPRELVLQFANEWAKYKAKKLQEIPSEIKEGKTVKKLDELLGKDTGWKKRLAEKIVEEMTPEQIEDEIKDKLTQIYEAIH